MQQHIGFCLVVGACYLVALAILNWLEHTDKFKKDKRLRLDRNGKPLRPIIRVDVKV